MKGPLLKLCLILFWVRNCHPLIFSNGGGGAPLFANFFLRPASIFQKRVSRSEFNLLSLRVKNLEEEFQELQENSELIQEALSNIRPRCPSTAVGAVVVGNLCFSLERVSETYNDAKSQCFLKGGMLAEPNYEDESFYSRLIAALPADTNAVSGNIFVQIVSSQTLLSYIYESNNLQIPNNADRWETTPTTFLPTEVAALKPSGTSWELVEVARTDTLPFLCQYDTVL